MANGSCSDCSNEDLWKLTESTEILEDWPVGSTTEAHVKEWRCGTCDRLVKRQVDW